MDALRVRWIDRKGFFYDEWITEVLEPVMTRRFTLEPAEAEGERSVQIRFQSERQEGNTIIYREVMA